MSKSELAFAEVFEISFALHARFSITNGARPKDIMPLTNEQIIFVIHHMLCALGIKDKEENDNDNDASSVA